MLLRPSKHSRYFGKEIRVHNSVKKNLELSEYLIALPSHPYSKGFNHRTILVSAHSEAEAIAIVRHLKPHDNIGEIKIVSF